MKPKQSAEILAIVEGGGNFLVTDLRKTLFPLSAFHRRAFSELDGQFS